MKRVLGRIDNCDNGFDAALPFGSCKQSGRGHKMRHEMMLFLQSDESGGDRTVKR